MPTKHFELLLLSLPSPSPLGCPLVSRRIPHTSLVVLPPCLFPSCEDCWTPSSLLRTCSATMLCFFEETLHLVLRKTRMDGSSITPVAVHNFKGPSRMEADFSSTTFVYGLVPVPQVFQSCPPVSLTRNSLLLVVAHPSTSFVVPCDDATLYTWLISL